MDLYSTLTIKDWSTLNTTDLIFQLICAMKKHDTASAIASFSELSKRKKSVITKEILKDSITDGAIDLDQDFSKSLQDALLHNCIHDPILLPYCNFILATNSWPHSESDFKSSSTLIKKYFKNVISPAFSTLPRKRFKFKFAIKEYGCYPFNNISTGTTENIWADLGASYELDLDKYHEIDYRDEYQFPNILALLYFNKIPLPLPSLAELEAEKYYTYRNNRWEELSEEENHIFYISFHSF